MIHPDGFLPFALPDIDEQEISEVVDTLRSGWLTTGPKAKRFESDFADYLGHGVRALAVNSATAGLHLALEAVGIMAGDEVIIPSYTFTSTAEVICYLGACPVVVDIDPQTYTIDPEAVAQAITQKTKAIIPVHFGGLVCDMGAILELARQYKLSVIEDAAHALPAISSEGELVGTLNSDATVFSFYANKTMTTGEGGMVVSCDDAVIERCKIMRLHGISKDAFDRYISKTPAWYYEVIAPGFKYNMPDIAAAVGIQQLLKLNSFHQKRLKLAKRYDEALADLPFILPPRPQNADRHAWHLYATQLHEKSRVNRDEFIQQMALLGIGCSVHFIPLHRQPFWKDHCHLTTQMFPVAESVFAHEVSLPLYTKMTDQDQEKVLVAIRKVLSL